MLCTYFPLHVCMPRLQQVRKRMLTKKRKFGCDVTDEYRSFKVLVCTFCTFVRSFNSSTRCDLRSNLVAIRMMLYAMLQMVERRCSYHELYTSRPAKEKERKRIAMHTLESDSLEPTAQNRSLDCVLHVQLWARHIQSKADCIHARIVRAYTCRIVSLCRSSDWCCIL